MPDQAPLLVAPCGSLKPIVPRSARRARPSQVGIGDLDHLYVGRNFYFDQSLILYVFLYFLLLQISRSLLQDSIFYLAHLPFRTPHLYIHHSAIDHISLNLSFFQAPHSFAIVAARVCRRQARLYNWFPYFLLLDFLLLILSWTLASSRVICAPVSPLPLRSCALTVRQRTKPPCCRSSVTYCCCLVTLYR